MAKQMKTCNLMDLIKSKLPPSSYEVIQLPTATNKISEKAESDEEQGAKRQKLMRSVFSRVVEVMRSVNTRAEEVTETVTSRAEKFRCKLDAKYPSFTKALVKSNVRGSFWMGLPVSFCKKHLPQNDTCFFLENEHGKQYRTKFLAHRLAFIGGWREFSVSEKLSEGNLLVFQLVGFVKFKVFRVRDGNDMNGAGIAQNLGTRVDQSATQKPDVAPEENTEIHQASSAKALSQDEDLQVPSFEQNVELHQASSTRTVSQDEAFAVPSVEQNVELHLASSAKVVSQDDDFDVPFSEQNVELHRTASVRAVSQDKDLGVPSVEQNVELHRASSARPVTQDEDHEVLSKGNYGTSQKEKASRKFNSGDNGHCQISPPVGKDCGVEKFEDFVTVIDDLLKSYYELPHHVKWSYYRLCSSQNALLHDNLLKGISPVMVAGCIIEMIDIASAMKSSELPTFLNEHALWGEKLSVLQALGMNVKFLCSHLERLQRIACSPEAEKNMQNYMELSSELNKIAHNVKSLKDKLSELIKVAERCADEMDKLRTVMEKDELRFREQVSVPW